MSFSKTYNKVQNIYLIKTTSLIIKRKRNFVYCGIVKLYINNKSPIQKNAMFSLLDQINQQQQMSSSSSRGGRENNDDDEFMLDQLLHIPTLSDVRKEKKTLAEGELIAPNEAGFIGQREKRNIENAVTRERASMNRYDIGAVEFSFMSTSTIQKMSEVRCTDQGVEGIYTVNSPRMGSIERNTECLTCGLPELDCPGHMGHIDFPVPLPHPLAIEYIVQTLQSVCANCGRLLLPQVSRSDPSLLRFKGASRLKEIAKRVSSSNTITCTRNLELAARMRAREEGKSSLPPPPAVDKDRADILKGDSENEDDDFSNDESFCHSSIPKYFGPKKDSTTDYHITAIVKTKAGKDRPAQRVSLDYIERVFDAIPVEDLSIMGFSGDSHPRNFIMRALPVIPPRNRPPVERDGDKKYDHLTTIYRDIIRDVQRLQRLLERKAAGAKDAENEISRVTGEMYNRVSHLMCNSDGTLKIKRTDVAITVAQRLTGKDGYCRGSAQGKRVNNSGRSVIGPGIMPFGSILIPAAMRTITIPERVTFLNIDRIREQVRRGEVIHLTRGSGIHAGIRMRLPKMIADAESKGEPSPDVEIGDLIERLSGLGDEVIVNRQPTLHRHSIIGVSAIPRLGQKTIKLHMAYT